MADIPLPDHCSRQPASMWGPVLANMPIPCFCATIPPGPPPLLPPGSPLLHPIPIPCFCTTIPPCPPPLLPPRSLLVHPSLRRRPVPVPPELHNLRWSKVVDCPSRLRRLGRTDPFGRCPHYHDVSLPYSIMRPNSQVPPPTNLMRPYPFPSPLPCPPSALEVILQMCNCGIVVWQ